MAAMTDIANEPDDQMSMVRFLVYSNQFDVEGLDRHDLHVDARPGQAGRHQHADRRLRRRCSRTCFSTSPDFPMPPP